MQKNLHFISQSLPLHQDNKEKVIMAEQTPHHGQAIDFAIKQSHLHLSDVADKMKVNRRTVYNWLQKEQLSDATISRIGDALGFNLYDKYPSVFIKKPAIVGAAKPENENNGTFSDRYISCLERNMQLQDLLAKANARILELESRIIA